MIEEEQLKTVKRDGRAIKYIDNPSEEVQLEAVKQNGLAIKYIENPSEQVQLEAVKENGCVIEYIKNPTEAVQLAAVKRNSYAIGYIKNPSPKLFTYELCLKYISCDKELYRFIPDEFITPEIKAYALLKGTDVK